MSTNNWMEPTRSDTRNLRPLACYTRTGKIQKPHPSTKRRDAAHKVFSAPLAGCQGSPDLQSVCRTYGAWIWFAMRTQRLRGWANL
jgi:hypothetical protein